MLFSLERKRGRGKEEKKNECNWCFPQNNQWEYLRGKEMKRKRKNTYFPLDLVFTYIGGKEKRKDEKEKHRWRGIRGDKNDA